MRKIAHISDLHFGRHDRRIAEDMLVGLARDQPDMVAVSGDLTQRARLSEFQAARAFLDRIPSRKLIVPGNHDVPLYDLWSRFGAPLGRYHRFIAPVGTAESFYHDDEIALLGLDTTRRLMNKRGRISIEQGKDVLREFRRLPPSVFKIVMTHHPLAVPTGQARFDVAHGGPAALAATSEVGIHLLLSGHRHRALGGHADVEVTRHGTILVVHAGTAISTRTRGGENNSYNLLRIDDGRVTVEVKGWSAGAGFHATDTTAYRLENGNWHTNPPLRLAARR